MRTKPLCLFLCSTLTLLSRADTLIGTGETLSVTNTEELGFSPIQMGAGSTLAFLGAAEGSAGVNAYVRNDANWLGTPGVNTYGAWTRVTNSAVYASTNITALLTEYIYTGRWYVPAAGTYSFYENIDNGASLAVDGMLLLHNTEHSVETRKQDVALAEGWHDLEIRVWNSTGTGGPYLAGLKSGVMYSPSNDVITLTNQTNAFPFADPGDGSVLRAVRNGNLFQRTVASGTVSFDLAGQGLAAPLAITGGLLSQPNSARAKVTVSGAGALAFGTTGLEINFPPFNVDVAFEGVGNPDGITFCGQSTIIAWPTSCVWRIAENATVALYGTNLLGAGDITLTNHSLFVLSPYAVTENATIRVRGTNLTASVKPCTLDPLGYWSGTAVTVTNDIALEGVGSAAVFPNHVDFYMQGKITGTGTVSKTGGLRTQIKEACDFVGDVSCRDNVLAFEAATAGHSNNTVTVGANGTFTLYPPGYGTSETKAWIKTLRSTSSTAKLYLPAKQTLTVDYLEGTLTVDSPGATLQVNTLGTNAVLNVMGTTAVVLDVIASGAAVNFANGNTALTYTGEGTRLDALNLTTGMVSVAGALTVGSLTGGGTLVKEGGATLEVAFCQLTGGFRIDAGKVLMAPLSTNSVLGSVPVLWLDASATNVFTQYKSYTTTNGLMVIERWNDRRPGAPHYAQQTRGEDQYQVYPYVMTNSQNGLSVVSMGSHQTTVSTVFGDRIEARRIYLSTNNLAPQYAVMVYGSQRGGGAAVLGTEIDAATTYFKRAGSTVEEYRNPATPILAASYPVWTNGISVTATNTGFSGGYQIVSVNTKGLSVAALGFVNSYATAGGQNYGEVLLYTNALTSLQRMTAELYLAQKWGLPYTAIAIPDVTVAGGATLEIRGPYTVGRINGAGSIIHSGSAPLPLDGVFTGTLELNGGTLKVADVAAVPDERAVPQNSLTMWFDPSVTNRVVLGGAYTPTRPKTIAALYDRTTTSRYLLGTCAAADLNYDRRPWLSETNGPLGGKQYWIDYANIYSNDVSGNTLRINRNPANIGTSVTTGVTPTNVQSGFIVLDSSRGGGVPITYNVYANEVVLRANPQSIASPIWGPGTTGSLTNGATYLDGVPVNGATRGYSGTAELLSFVATNRFQAAYFGYYGNDNVATPNRERLGEIILFESALDVGTRSDIEAYLMKKWLGRARTGYGDVTAASVSGSGTVQAAKPSQLPVLAEGFTGQVQLSGASFDYTFTTNAAGQHVLSPATAIPGVLTVSAAGTVNVHFSVRPPVGTYALVTYGAVTGSGFAGWTLNTTGSEPAGSVVLKPTATALNILVVSQGTVLQLL